MKLKTALKLSLVVNAIFVLAVAYMTATDIKLDTTPAFIYVTNAPAATATAELGSLTVASH
jgi:hypothetical protein